MFEWLFKRRRAKRPRPAAAAAEPEHPAPSPREAAELTPTPVPAGAPLSRPSAGPPLRTRTADDVLRELESQPARRPRREPAVAEEKPIDPNLGRHLLAEGPITREFLQQQLTLSGKADTYLGQVLAKLPAPSEEKLFRVLGAAQEIPLVDLKQCKIMASVARSVPAELLRKYRMVPIEQFGDLLCAVFAGEVNPKATEAIRRATGLRVKALRCPPHHIELLLRRLGHEAATAQVVAAVPAPEAEPEEAHRGPEARWESMYVSRGPLKAVRLA